MLTEDEIHHALTVEFNKLKTIPSYHCGERMPTYKIREEIKSLGWKLYSLSLEEGDFLKAAHAIIEYVIWSHYWRCREDLENMKANINNMKKVLGTSLLILTKKPIATP